MHEDSTFRKNNLKFALETDKSMNIPVITSNGKIIVRPDTTWERDNEDVYLPEFVDSLSWTPVFFVRVSKPGRSIGEKFASRYYDAVGYGVLLYPENLIDGSEEGFACASCLDKTSFLPFPLYNPVTLGVDGNEFVLRCADRELFRSSAGSRSLAERALVEVSRRCYLRTGDLVAVELQAREKLLTRTEGSARVEGTYCENPTVDFKVIF